MSLTTQARAVARHAALDVLSGRERLASRGSSALARARVHLPYLHAVPGRKEDAFRRFLEALAATHEFVSYSEAVRRVREGPIDRPCVSLSFDDGFKSNVRVSRILEEYGTVGMFFVPSAFVGTPTVAKAREFYGFAEGVDEPAMTWDDLEEMKGRGHEIGNHTRGHQVLSWVSPEEMYDEVAEGAAALRSRLGDVEHFAWPRGRFFHFTEQAALAVFETGHVSCASAERGAHTNPQLGDPRSLCLRRDHIMTSWPLRHSMYFVARSSARSGPGANNWPAAWQVV